MKIGILFLLLVSFVVSARAERKLRYRVDVGQVQSRSFPVPGGEFDFGFVMNQQLMLELVNSDEFFAPFVVSQAYISGSSEAITEATNILVPPTDMLGNPVPACISKKDYAKIYGDVVSFELEGGQSIKIGYSQGPTHNPDWGISGKVAVKKSRLWMHLYAVDPFTGEAFGASKGESVAKYRSTDMEINFSGFSTSPSFFHESKLAAVTRNATRDALKNISAEIKDRASRGLAPEWATSISRMDDAIIEIRAGKADGVKVGDRFLVTNIVHEWSGEVCNSEYKATPVRTAGIVEVHTAGRLYSYVKRIDGRYDFHVGDQVTIEKLAD